MKTILLLLTFVPTILFGQQTKRVTDKENNETFYVLKSDRATKHGEYKKFRHKDMLLVKGYYRQGVKDSIWECYDFEGQPTLKYDYTKKEVVLYKPSELAKEIKYRIVNADNTSDLTLSRPPIYLSGNEFIRSEVARNIHYPITAAENGKSGKVYVSFIVDKYGKTKNFHVKAPLGYGMDEEAVRVLKLIPDNWLPGLLNGHLVDVEVIYPIIYRLQ